MLKIDEIGEMKKTKVCRGLREDETFSENKPFKSRMFMIFPTAESFVDGKFFILEILSIFI